MSDGYTVIPYEERYRDDMIFMVLEAKDALGRVPRLNEDLLDIRRHYLDAGFFLWFAVDAHDRVIGCTVVWSAITAWRSVRKPFIMRPWPLPAAL